MPRSAAGNPSRLLTWPLVVATTFIVLFSAGKAGAVAPETPHHLSVPSTSAWTRTGIQVRSGDTVVVGTTGTVAFRGPTNKVGPEGVPWGAACDKRESEATVKAPWPAPGAACWSLIGRIGTGKPFEVGRSKQVRAADTGELQLGINDNYIADNSGAWKSTVFVLPGATAASSGATKHSSNALLFVIGGLVAIALIAFLVFLLRRSRRRAEPEAVAAAVAATQAEPSAAVREPAVPLVPTDDEQTVVPGEHDATKVNIFEVTLTTTMLRVGYNHFPAGVRVDWTIRWALVSQSVGSFVTNGGGDTQHYVSFPVDAPDGFGAAASVDFRWTIDEVPFTYAVRRDPSDTARRPAVDSPRD